MEGNIFMGNTAISLHSHSVPWPWPLASICVSWGFCRSSDEPLSIETVQASSAATPHPTAPIAIQAIVIFRQLEASLPPSATAAAAAPV